MPLANLTTSMSSPLQLFPSALGNADIGSSAVKSAVDAGSHHSWDEAYNELIDWWKVVGEIDEDGLQSPTPISIRAATQIICDLRAVGGPAPTRVVMGGDGGIAIELASGEITARIEVDSGGLAEFIIFKRHRILVRQQLGV